MPIMAAEQLATTEGKKVAAQRIDYFAEHCNCASGATYRRRYACRSSNSLNAVRTEHALE